MRRKSQILVAEKREQCLLSLSVCLGPRFVERRQLPLGSAESLAGRRSAIGAGHERRMTSPLERLQQWRNGEEDKGIKQFVVTVPRVFFAGRSYVFRVFPRVCVCLGVQLI